VVLDLQTHREKLFLSFGTVRTFFGDNLMSIDSSEESLDEVINTFLTGTSFHFLEQNGGKFVDVHLLIELYHRLFIVGFEGPREIARIYIVFFRKLEFQKQFLECL
jgi:hypothetical protein